MVHGEPTHMGTHNGHAYLELVRQLVSDLTTHYPEHSLGLSRDMALIERRFTNEGLNFLTKVLPQFGKAIDRALSNSGKLVTQSFKKKGRSALPVFLWDFTSKIFDEEGYPRPNGCPGALLELRQLSYLLYKLEVPYEEATILEKVHNFVNVDLSLNFCPNDITGANKRVLQSARSLLGHLLRDFTLIDALPAHGPGAVAGRERAWEKMEFKHFVKQIDEAFTFSEWYYLSPTHLCDDLQSFLGMQEVDHLYSRLEVVPKDSRGPRLIGLEPCEYMWIQQAIKGKLYPYLESHPLTKGHVNFSDQTINGRLALEASLDGVYSTLDMKDASDRVALGLVEYLFADTQLLPALLATRTPGVVLPNGDTHVYRKFAPMGSALCFPVEALCFWALTVATLNVLCEQPLLKSTKMIYIYGDDIIIPTDFSMTVMRTLPHFDLIFNEDKCCIHGSFKESCGVDAYRGVNVTPIKIKKLVPQFVRSKRPKCKNKALNVDQPTAVASYIEYSNLFYERGYYKTARFLEKLVTEHLGELPVSEGTTPMPLFLRSRSGSCNTNLKFRLNKSEQYYEVYAWDLRPVKHTEVEVDGWHQPLRTLTMGSSERGPWVYDIPYRSQLVKRWRRLDIMPTKI